MLGSLTEIVSAHLSHNPVAASDVPQFIRRVHETLTELEGGPTLYAESGKSSRDNPEGSDVPPLSRTPAVPISESVSHEFIICLEDGKRLRMLKRYLMAQYGMTPEQYRSRWNLPADYPMAAPALLEQRRSSAVAGGLGVRKSNLSKPDKRSQKRDRRG
ncbi:MucR family transcriptional regulator [Novosphingobium sp. 1Y9A]|uniref:MucR family transcriptional regulator n=1 Tax=Novosphingobium jiangmenense TaxID=2791981 RepID=A0ABS0HLC9_9SPHN|nr:MucR family transcriptional regulator [Novosphingobium jiangmenense]